VSDRPQGTSTASPLTSGNTRLSRGQGVIPEQDHKEQAQSYRNMESAADRRHLPRKRLPSVPSGVQR
jgi:hypothetical protein